MAAFASLNLVFVPLLSLYGLRVCPVLHLGGFTAGCYYAGTFTAAVLALNALFVRALAYGRPGPLTALAASRPLLAYPAVYCRHAAAENQPILRRESPAAARAGKKAREKESAYSLSDELWARLHRTVHPILKTLYC